MPASAARPAGEPLHHRLALFVAAAAIPLSLQLAYVVSIPFAGRLGPGAVTSFGYAYLAATTVAGITAFSIGLVSSVPLSRIELTPAAIARHVVAATWVALVIVGAAVGVLALAGADLVEAFLGPRTATTSGDEVAALIVVFAAWMVAAVGVNVTFPLAFVTDRLRALPWIGVAALAAQVLLAWIGVELFELDGLAFSLALSTLFVLAALLVQLGAAERGTPRHRARGSRRRGAHGARVRPAAARRRGHRQRARRPRALRRSSCRDSPAGPQELVVVPSRAPLARLPPLQAGAAAIELDEGEAGARAEDAMTARCDGAVERRQVAERHVPAEPLAFPVERRQLVRELAEDDRPVADRVLDLPGLRASRVVEHDGDRRHVRVVEKDAPADLQPRREVPPVENRVREPVRAVEQGEIEQSRRTGEAARRASSPTSNETRSLETPSSRHAARTRASSSGSGVTAT